MTTRTDGQRAAAQGFTLVELLVALLVFALLAAAGIAVLRISVQSQGRCVRGWTSWPPPAASMRCCAPIWPRRCRARRAMPPGRWNRPLPAGPTASLWCAAAGTIWTMPPGPSCSGSNTGWRARGWRGGSGRCSMVPRRSRQSR
ncbi:prepilin-type N-terminal cleavage/methylation domain-containing protein [Sphingomonas changnyeongensis]|uniref:Prepilin-type N-terminal cleavage/methylation domain-containing protein n=1 Tax=Sphingomonas changnyeongensis TaxID=2698679 RepID=A0A7Z2NWX3_9SPHN|nr:prepilin-type N-terminal cleavage/methylation domain-containing protein [Sphingomonas changnyeongensis]